MADNNENKYLIESKGNILYQIKNFIKKLLNIKRKKDIERYRINEKKCIDEELLKLEEEEFKRTKERIEANKNVNYEFVIDEEDDLDEELQEENVEKIKINGKEEFFEVYNKVKNNEISIKCLEIIDLLKINEMLKEEIYIINNEQ